ncbi:MAG: glycosyltransferase, partial [Chlorobi bacterium]|nr:glycosyltransferase [Chlorobiota bacterium]
MLGDNLTISIVIVNYFTTELIKQLLVPFVNDNNFQIIIVDNSGDYDELSQIKGNNITVIACKGNVGFGRGCNIGIKKVQGEFCLFLNPDTKITKNHVFKLKEFLSKQKKAIVSPALYISESIFASPLIHPSPFSEFLQIICLKFEFINKLFGKIYAKKIFARHFNDKKPFKVKTLSGGCFMVKNSVFRDKNDFFDKDYFMYFEDSHLFRSLRKKGYSFFILPETKVLHSSKIDKNKIKLMESSQQIYYKKNYTFFIFSLLRQLNKKLANIKKQIAFQKVRNMYLEDSV